MKTRVTLMYAAVALLSLVVAYFTWQRPKQDSTAESVKVIDIARQALGKVRFEDGTRFIELERETEPKPTVWITMGFLPGKAPVVDAGLSVTTLDGGADGGVDGGVSAPMVVNVRPAEPPPIRTVRGNERADALLGRFAPLEASRALGSLADEKLTELGLSGSERRLDVTVAGTPRAFAVSKPLPGIIGAYLKDAKSNEVFLITSTLLSELDPASQSLVDRRLHAFKQSDFEHFTLRAGDKSVEFVQTDAAIPATAKVARASSPTKTEELVKNWHDKVWNHIVVTEVLGKGEQPKAGEPVVQLRVEYAGRTAPAGWLELALDPKNAAWARSENTASWVSVGQTAEELIIEGKKIASE